MQADKPDTAESATPAISDAGSAVDPVAEGTSSAAAADREPGAAPAPLLGPEAEPEPEPASLPPATSHITNGRPSRSQFSVLAYRTFQVSSGSVVRDVISPIQILFYPIVLWASMAMGFAANSLLALNLTQAQVFGPPPYAFSPDQIGYVNFAFVVGAALALVTAGPLSDRIAMRRARAHGGVLEAEMRLPALIPYVAINLIGMVITAVGYQLSWPWEAIVVAGYMLVGIQVVGIPAITISYAVDCYKSLPGEIMIAATIVKNTFGVSFFPSLVSFPRSLWSVANRLVFTQFGMIFFFNQWAAKSGYLAPVLLLMALTVGFSVIGLAVFIPFGKRFRRFTKDSKLHTL